MGWSRRRCWPTGRTGPWRTEDAFEINLDEKTCRCPAGQKLRKEQATEAFQAEYRKRAGVERTIAHLTRRGGRHARFFGIVKTRFQLIMAGVLQNLRVVTRVPEGA